MLTGYLASNTKTASTYTDTNWGLRAAVKAGSRSTLIRMSNRCEERGKIQRLSGGQEKNGQAIKNR